MEDKSHVPFHDTISSMYYDTEITCQIFNEISSDKQFYILIHKNGLHINSKTEEDVDSDNTYFCEESSLPIWVFNTSYYYSLVTVPSDAC
jgi:hypothetical protein